MLSFRSPADAMGAVLFVLISFQCHHATSFSTPRYDLQRMGQVHVQPRFAPPAVAKTALYLSSSDIQEKLKAQMTKLQERDRSSKEVSSDVSTSDMLGFLVQIIFCSMVLKVHNMLCRLIICLFKILYKFHRSLMLSTKMIKSLLSTNHLVY